MRTAERNNILAERLSLARSIRNLMLFPGTDYSFTSADRSVSVDIFWHSPSINVGWYPIIQVDKNDRTVYHREGSESPQMWTRNLSDWADFIETTDKLD